jgi:hypothetical protein
MHLSPRSSFTIRFFPTRTLQAFPQDTLIQHRLLFYITISHQACQILLVRFVFDSPGSDPKSFEDGVDLIEHDGIWRLTLVHLAGHARYAGIFSQLLSDGLVTPELLSVCKHLWAELKLIRTDKRLNILLSLSQDFFIHLTAATFTVVSVNRGTASHRCCIRHILCRNSVRFFTQGTSFLSVWFTCIIQCIPYQARQ